MYLQTYPGKKNQKKPQKKQKKQTKKTNQKNNNNNKKKKPGHLTSVSCGTNVLLGGSYMYTPAVSDRISYASQAHIHSI